MASVTLFSLSRFRRTGSWIDHALYAVAVYAVPLLIAIGTIAALFVLPRQYESRGALPLGLRVVSDAHEPMRSKRSATRPKRAATARNSPKRPSGSRSPSPA
jgi:hypothetical protein